MISYRKRLIGLTALSVTILFSLPRVAALSFVARKSGIEPDMADFMARVAYTFVIAMVFLSLNLRRRKFSLAHRNLDLGRTSHAVITNIALAMVLNTGFLWLHHHTFEPAFDPRLFRFFFNISFYLEVLLVVALAHIYRLLLFNQEMKLANEQLLTVNAETRYQALVSQVDPHYLFNSLNTITALIRQDKDTAIRYVTDMSQTMRYTLESGRQDLIPLERELEFVGAYSNMLSSRYGDKLRINILIDDSQQQLLLPPMALQVLIENALNHNMITREYPLIIDIAAHHRELVVSNTLQPKKNPANSTGIGLSNLNERCRHLYRKEIIIRKTEQLFTVIIPLSDRHENTDH